ncbi:TolC family protein [Zeimonas arvi]|jgi:cobalt-zinc-cadmium efflux system outer membrane protein|uniref:TolC family protein n=1 Tax=Zeimonas arvi TaxID=2498847 RepID=A0A5C8NRX7_9BURK|nr:TolC family protein [Zeimonas arvi]ODS99599.1 MAG: transporter [Lautropia sp. SCN 69-89]TXL63887.1 TolC family protein [Zeimonas arvi]
MHESRSTRGRVSRALAGLALAACASAAAAQAAAAGQAPSLGQAFEAAWARQPEAQALPARRDAALARQRASRAWSPEAPALELAARTDRLNDNLGTQELEVGVAMPLWLPGERARSEALAQAESDAVDSLALGARLRVAADVREAWWGWHRARIEAEVASLQLDNARRIAADVARRVGAGELARADRHQADGAVAAAESGLAQARASASTALQRLRAVTGLALRPADAGDAAPEPLPERAAPQAAEHGALRELADRAEVADRTAALAATQRRANPELLLAATRERDAFGEPHRQSITLGVRIPFGAGPRADARIAAARAEALAARARLALERERLLAEREAAGARVDSARMQLAAAERRLELARESRGFFEKSFRLGETDLPTRLRIEAEAAEAERQAARARVELAAAISALRQVLGLLPQ